MAASEARVATPNASRYLQQLCKHWSHKFTVEFTPEKGMVPFSSDRSCVLKATPDTLTLRVDVADPAGLDRLQTVVVDHLKRFAFRENLDDIRWQKVS